MKHLLKIILLTMTTFSGCITASAQNFPVQANLSITPPYSVHLQDYVTPGVDRMALNLLLTDLNRADLQVKLRLTIEGQGIKLQTKQSWLPEPIIISGGVPERYVGFDLAEYFNPDHLNFEGITKREFVQTGALPEGVYRFCIQVQEYNRNVNISNPACVTTWLILNDPPMINLPANGKKVRATDPQNVIFQWTPRHTGSPNSAFSTEYEFKIVEIWPEGRNPNDAIRTSNTIFQTTTQSTTLVYGIAKPPLIPGRSYAFRVKAKSIAGVDELDLFKNEGYSETYMFTFGDECKAPTNLSGRSISSKRISTSWESAFNHTGFNVRYKEDKRDASWFDEETFINDQSINSLKPDTRYELQVQASCGSLSSEYSEPITVRTDAPTLEDFVCGATPDAFGLNNSEPLQGLRKGDYIYVNDFDVKIDSISGGNGIFSGTGLAEMPFLSLVKVRVRFDNIAVNTDYRMIDGQVFTIYNPDSKNVVDLDEEEEDITESEDGESKDEGSGDDNAFNDGEIAIDGDIDTVYVNDNGDIVVVDNEGSETTYEPAADEDGNPEDTEITDGSGDTWNVDSGGNVSQGGGTGSDGTTETDSVMYVQKELIKEALEHYKTEINLWLENNGKGPLEEAMVRRLMAMPDCLPADEEQLQAVLAKIEEYLEDSETLLELVKEVDANKTRIDELVAQLNGKRPPYNSELSDSEWDNLLEMLCPYLVEEEERPELVTMEPITDDQFAAGIDNDKLGITYSIKATEKYPLQYAKLEVYKNDGTLAYVNSENIEIGEGKTFAWDGKMNQGANVDKYIRYDDGEFTIKVIASVDEDFSASFEAEAKAVVFRKTDEFRDNPDVVAYITPPTGVSRFEYYLLLEEELYNKISSNQTDENFAEIFRNGLDYLGEKVNKRTFIGREVMVHDNYWTYLQDIDGKLGSEYDNHPDYTMGGFSIRFQLGSNDAVSNHAYGMALDVNSQRNPYLSKGQLYFLQLLTDFKFFQNPSNPEDLKEAHDQLIGFGYQQVNITSMKEGFEHLSQSSLKAENFETLLNEVFGSYRSAAATFSQLVSRNTYLRNEVHFFNQKTAQEVAEIERQLFEELPAEADALLETVKAIRSTEEISQLYDLYKEGYLKAFLLDKHTTSENATLLTVLDNLKGLFGFEAAIASLKEACEQPVNEDYTHWVTNVDITQPQSVPEASTYQAVGTFIESMKTDYREIFYSTSSYSGVISVLNSSATNLAQNGFMLMSAAFAREFVDVGNSVISWGGNWKGLKDFMHMEYVEKDRFNNK